MKQSVDRILTTHVGSLPRPKDLLDLIKVKVASLAYDRGAYDKRVKSAVAECVRKQVGDRYRHRQRRRAVQAGLLQLRTRAARRGIPGGARTSVGAGEICRDRGGAGGADGRALCGLPDGAVRSVERDYQVAGYSGGVGGPWRNALLGEKELWPGAGMLEKINASLR